MARLAQRMDRAEAALSDDLSGADLWESTVAQLTAASGYDSDLIRMAMVRVLNDERAGRLDPDSIAKVARELSITPHVVIASIRDFRRRAWG